MALMTSPVDSEAVVEADTFGERLNPAQRRAATFGRAVRPSGGRPPGFESAPLLIIAGAGTGKTNTLAHRVAWLLLQGVAPERIALLTFTRRAARERRRLDVMHRDLQVFAEASTRVADTLDHLLRGDVPEPEAPTSSRRYLLHQARERLERGETAEQVATQLALCEDERRLLEFLGSGGGGGGLRRQVHVA